MSTYWTDWVWKSADASGARLLVLLALADNADEATGHCWPSIAYLARKTRMHEDTVKRHLHALAKGGTIRIQEKPGRPNSYFMVARTPLQSTPPQSAPPGDSPPGDLRGTPPRSGPPHPPVELAGGNRKEPSGNPRVRATTIPDDFVLTEEMRSWASVHAPACDVDRVTDAFVDYWREGNGAGKQHKNWVSTWRNWLRSEQSKLERFGWKPAPGPDEVVEVENATTRRLERERDEWLARHGLTLAEFEANRDKPGWLEQFREGDVA